MVSGRQKPHDMKIFSWKQDVTQEHENQFQMAWPALAQGITSIFTNQKKDQFATCVPISGRIDDKKFDAWRAIVNVLHNASPRPTPRLQDITLTAIIRLKLTSSPFPMESAQ
jgi:hypothetical protein